MDLIGGDRMLLSENAPRVWLITAIAVSLLTACGSTGGSAEAGATAHMDRGGKPTPSSSGSEGSRPPDEQAKLPMAKAPAGLDMRLVSPRKLTFCDPFSREPYAFKASYHSGRVSGFDVDILSLVAERLEVKFYGVPTDSDDPSGIEALQSGHCDVIGPWIVDEQPLPNWMTLTTPHRQHSRGLLTTRKTPYGSLEELKGKRVGLPDPGTETPDAKWLAQQNTDHRRGIQITPLPDHTVSAHAVQAGRIDALLTDHETALYWANECRPRATAQLCDKTGKLKASPRLEAPAPVAFIVRRNKPALRQQIDAALRNATNNKRYTQTYQHWFGIRPNWQPGS